MVKSTAVSCIHPDKYNNSVDRIISKEEEREDIQGEISSTLQLQWCFHIQSILQELQVYRMPLLVLTSIISINNLHTIQ